MKRPSQLVALALGAALTTAPASAAAGVTLRLAAAGPTDAHPGSASTFDGLLTVADLNGDGIAHVVAAGRTEPGNVPREGRGDFTPATGQSTGGAFRKRRTNSSSVGLGINPIVFDTSSSGRGLSSNTRMPSDSGGGGGGSGSLGGGAGLGVTRSATTREVLDLKGDGLPA